MNIVVEFEFNNTVFANVYQDGKKVGKISLTKDTFDLLVPILQKNLDGFRFEPIIE